MNKRFNLSLLAVSIFLANVASQAMMTPSTLKKNNFEFKEQASWDRFNKQPSSSLALGALLQTKKTTDNVKELSVVQQPKNLSKRERIDQFIHQPIAVPEFYKKSVENFIELANGTYKVKEAEIQQFKTFTNPREDFGTLIDHFDLSQSGITKETFNTLLTLLKSNADKRKELIEHYSQNELKQIFNACFHLEPVKEVTELCAQALLNGDYDKTLFAQATKVLEKKNLNQLLFLACNVEKRSEIFNKIDEKGILDLSGLELGSFEGIDKLIEYIDTAKITELNLNDNYLKTISFKDLKKLFPNLAKVSATNNCLSSCTMQDMYLFEEVNLEKNPIEKITNLPVLDQIRYSYGKKQMPKKLKLVLDKNGEKDVGNMLNEYNNCIMSQLTSADQLTLLIKKITGSDKLGRFSPQGLPLSVAIGGPFYVSLGVLLGYLPTDDLRHLFFASFVTYFPVFLGAWLEKRFFQDALLASTKTNNAIVNSVAYINNLGTSTTTFNNGDKYEFEIEAKDK